MKVGIITQPNAKGQVVIPKTIRTELGIESETNLEVSLKDGGVFLRPVDIIVTDKNKKVDYKKILRKTQGAWANDKHANAMLKSLRGSVIYYKNPTEPVGVNDWEALQ